MEDKDSIVRRSISLSKEMDDWLKEHPEVNSSALFRQSVYELQGGDAIRVSLYGLVFFILISFSFLMMMWMIIPKGVLFIFSICFMTVCSLILIKSVILFNKYQEEMKKWKKQDLNLEEKESLLNGNKQ